MAKRGCKINNSYNCLYLKRTLKNPFLNFWIVQFVYIGFVFYLLVKSNKFSLNKKSRFWRH